MAEEKVVGATFPVPKPLLSRILDGGRPFLLSPRRSGSSPV